jgi:hypothetical protein
VFVGSEFLQPDEVTFAVLLRGYGASDPPAWQRIDATLTLMMQQHRLRPTSSKHIGVKKKTSAMLQVSLLVFKATTAMPQGLNLLPVFQCIAASAYNSFPNSSC